MATPVSRVELGVPTLRRRPISMSVIGTRPEMKRSVWSHCRFGSARVAQVGGTKVTHSPARTLVEGDDFLVATEIDVVLRFGSNSIAQYRGISPDSSWTAAA
jgi:hypothetical protein